jgi:hypothetical protein
LKYRSGADRAIYLAAIAAWQGILNPGTIENQKTV